MSDAGQFIRSDNGLLLNDGAYFHYPSSTITKSSGRCGLFGCYYRPLAVNHKLAFSFTKFNTSRSRATDIWKSFHLMR